MSEGQVGRVRLRAAGSACSPSAPLETAKKKASDWFVGGGESLDRRPR